MSQLYSYPYFPLYRPAESRLRAELPAPHPAINSFVNQRVLWGILVKNYLDDALDS
jgi:hypothetical protein